MDLSLVIPVINEEKNISYLIPTLKETLKELGVLYEVLIVDGGSTDKTAETARRLGAQVLFQERDGYGEALKTGFCQARGDYILTLDADLTHRPNFIKSMWDRRKEAELIIASRFIRGSIAYMPLFRKVLSKTLNLFFSKGLSLPIRDLSSGFRLYRADIINGLSLENRNFEILEEILIKIYVEGFNIKEIPFIYYPRKYGSSHARIFAFGIRLFKTFFRMRKIRISIESADYEERAFYSPILPQRYWNRKRYKIVTSMTQHCKRILDIGCGSSRILLSLNNGVGLDIALNKLRYMKRYGCELINGSIPSLPFRDESFDCIICSQVIEHVPYQEKIFSELNRVLKSKGTLILGTPDYSTIGWRIIEPLYGFFIPGGYKDKHITRYTKGSLQEILSRHNFTIEERRYILKSDLMLRCKKID